MRKGKRNPSREGIDTKIRENEDDMKAKEGKMERTASDVEIVRETYEELELDGTVEGTDEVEAEIERAEDVTVEVFDQEDADLEIVQESSVEYKNEINERNDSSENDLRKVSLARSKIETQDTITELEKAKEAVLKDIDFLIEKMEAAKEDIEKSEESQESLNQRVHDRKRSKNV